jgi:hypothetical protein
VLAPYGEQMGVLAATWYEDLRAEAGAPGRFTPVLLTETVQPERVRSLVEWSVGPLFEQSTDSTVVDLLAGGAQRLLADVGRDTVFGNAEIDPAPVGYQRVPAPGCCAFCAMLASRGMDFTYRSKQSAVRVVGRGAAILPGPRRRGGQPKGIRPRGTRKIGEKYHDWCRCEGVPVFPGAPVEFSPEVEDLLGAFFTASQNVHGPRDSVWSQWYAARRRGEAWTEAPEFDISAKRILAEMRRLTGAR